MYTNPKASFCGVVKNTVTFIHRVPPFIHRVSLIGSLPRRRVITKLALNPKSSVMIIDNDSQATRDATVTNLVPSTQSCSSWYTLLLYCCIPVVTRQKLTLVTGDDGNKCIGQQEMHLLGAANAILHGQLNQLISARRAATVQAIFLIIYVSF